MTVGTRCEHEPMVVLTALSIVPLKSIVCPCVKCGQQVTFFLPDPRLLPDNVIPLRRRA